MTASHLYIDTGDRNLCDSCNEWAGAKQHRVEHERWPGVRHTIDDSVLYDVLHLVLRHTLTHQNDDLELDLAIELLKAVRYEPPYLATLYERWAEEFLAIHQSSTSKSHLMTKPAAPSSQKVRTVEDVA